MASAPPPWDATAEDLLKASALAANQMKEATRLYQALKAELAEYPPKLEAEIKKAAKMGNKQAATVLAKQLINVRKQKTRTYNMTSKVEMGFRHQSSWD